MLRKFCLILFLALLSWPLLNAQNEAQPGDRFARIKEARKAFLTEKLSLTTEEQEKFFPLFWRYEREMNSLRRSRTRAKRESGNQELAKLTEAEAREMLELQLETDKKMLQLRRRAMAEFIKVIPATKLIQLENAERTFRRQLVERVRGARDRNLRPASREGRF